MAVINVTSRDVLRSKQVTAGTYTVNIDKEYTVPAKTDGSTRFIIEMTISDGPFKGVPLEVSFSEKAVGFAIPLLTACGAAVSADGGQFDFADCVNKQIKVSVTNEKVDNRWVNKVVDYFPLSAGSSVSTVVA